MLLIQASPYLATRQSPRFTRLLEIHSGTGCWIGFGSSALFPLAMSAAAQQTDRPAAINVAALAQFSFPAFLLGPPLLGFIAEHFGIQWTFGVGFPLVLLGLFTAHVLAPRPIIKTVTP